MPPNDGVGVTVRHALAAAVLLASVAPRGASLPRSQRSYQRLFLVDDHDAVVRHIATVKNSTQHGIRAQRRQLQGECHSPDVCNPLPPAVKEYGRTHPSCVPRRDDKRCCRMGSGTMPEPFAMERQFPIAMHGITGEVCAPECIDGACPAGNALPPGTLAKPQCVIRACSDATFCDGIPLQRSLCALTCAADAMLLPGHSSC